MTQYAGGKARIGKRIYKAIKDYELSVTGNNDSPYFEPFVGMGGVLYHFAAEKYRPIYACDREECIVNFWRGIQNDWIPPELTKESYDETKQKNKQDADYAFAAFGCSFRGSKWTYFYEDCMRRATKRIKNKKFKEVMSDVTFQDCQSYTEHNPSAMLIYCDPPYAISSFDNRRNNLTDFDTDQFWSIMRDWSRDNLVIISETKAPDDFRSIHSFERKNAFNKKVIIESLFVIDEKSCQDNEQS